MGGGSARTASWTSAARPFCVGVQMGRSVVFITSVTFSRRRLPMRPAEGPGGGTVERGLSHQRQSRPQRATIGWCAVRRIHRTQRCGVLRSSQRLEEQSLLERFFPSAAAERTRWVVHGVLVLREPLCVHERDGDLRERGERRHTVSGRREGQASSVCLLRNCHGLPAPCRPGASAERCRWPAGLPWSRQRTQESPQVRGGGSGSPTASPAWWFARKGS